MAKYYTPVKLSDNISETPEGYLLCLNVPIARTGWMEYGQGECPLEPGEDGIVHVYRSADEVFRAQTMASFEGKPLTVKHPEDFVSPDNWSDLSKGLVQNVRRSKEKDEDGEESLLADILVTEAIAIQLVKKGLREVSCGYEAEYEQTEIGKGRQTNIVGNHLALVEQGRAGSSYAINDEKGKATMSVKMLDKLKAKFGSKAVDEAMAENEEKKSGDAGMYDELVKAVKDLGEKVESMSKPKDEEKEKEAPKKEEPAAKDAEVAAGLEERLKALEAAVAKLLEMEKAESGDEDEDMSESDAEDEESKESEKKTGDSARCEILAPGLKAGRSESLQAAYKTADGKEVIDAILGGKAPDFESDALFYSASEVLKTKRGTGLAGTKNAKAFDTVGESVNEPMTAEELNKINAAYWAGKQGK